MARLFLSRLAISHFRSHRSFDVALDGRPVAIFGPNGAGKTNLIEAVSMLSPGRGLRRAVSDDLSRRPETIGWRVGATVATPGADHEIDTRAEPGQGRSVRIDDKTVPQNALGQVVRMLWLVPSMDRLWIEGAEGRRRFLDRMTLSFLPGHGDATIAYDKAMRERNRLLKDRVQDRRWYEALEAQMVQSGSEIVAGRNEALSRILQAQDAAPGTFPVSDLEIVDPESAPPLDPRALADGRPRDMAAGRTLIGPHRADLRAIYRDKGIEAAMSSTGEQKALLISLILANARALKTERAAAPLLLLDEVTAHLDAGRRAALHEEILATGAQAWMTGTSAALFDDLGDRAQRLSVSETDGASRVSLVQA